VGEDWLVQVNIPTDGQWFFSTCHPTVNWDSYMYLTTNCCAGIIAQDDDACPEFGVGLSRIPFSACMTLTAGTYYVDLEPFSSLGCGDIALTVGECAPCVITCQGGDVPECAEPVTPDSTNMSNDCNGGCNNTSGNFTNQPLACGQTVCGRLFTYLRPSGTNVRDTDAYDFTITETCTVRWSARAECPIDLYILNSGCPWATVYAFGSQATPCSMGVALAICLPAGSYTAWIGPSVFTGIPTPVEYRATLECIPCPPPGEGDDCQNSYPIPGLPFNVTDNSCNYQDNSDEICPFGGSTSSDVAYTYVPAADVQVNVDLCNSEYDTKVYVYENGILLACNDDFCSDPLGNPFRSFLNCVQLLAGNTYCFVVDGYGGDCGVYNLSISECTPCIINCEPGDVDEVVEDFNDPNFYVTDPDGGCNNDVPAFQDIECGSTICGITRTYTSPLGDTRDTDWFRFTLFTQTNVTWRVQSETAVTIFLIDITDCNAVIILAQGNVFVPCVDEGVATADLAPGTYAAWVGPSVFAGVPVSAYRGTLDAVCACETPEDLTVLRGVGPANSVNLRWIATQNIGRYEVYRSTNPNNDGDPDNGADPLWGAPIAVIPAPAAPPATLTYTDAGILTYANYTVVHNCAPIARCCYNGGADCANNTQAECDALAGVWDFGLSCENDPCPVILLGDDACGAANPLLTNGQMIVGNNVGATTDAVWGCASGGSDVWYRYTATATGTVDVNLCGSLYDTAVQVQDACGGVVIVCQDDSECGLQSHTSFAGTSGVTYWIAVGGFLSNQGTYNLLVSQ
jgi:hypothetical protein